MAINQVIYCVREGPFSIEFMTCCKKQMLQRYWKFSGYIMIWHERAAVKDEGPCLIMILLSVYVSGWKDPIGWRLRLRQNLYCVLSWLLSINHEPVQRCSEYLAFSTSRRNKTHWSLWSISPALPVLNTFHTTIVEDMSSLLFSTQPTNYNGFIKMAVGRNKERERERKVAHFIWYSSWSMAGTAVSCSRFQDREVTVEGAVCKS